MKRRQLFQAGLITAFILLLGLSFAASTPTPANAQGSFTYVWNASTGFADWQIGDSTGVVNSTSIDATCNSASPASWKAINTYWIPPSGYTVTSVEVLYTRTNGTSDPGPSTPHDVLSAFWDDSGARLVNRNWPNSDLSMSYSGSFAGNGLLIFLYSAYDYNTLSVCDGDVSIYQITVTGTGLPTATPTMTPTPPPVPTDITGSGVFPECPGFNRDTSIFANLSSPTSQWSLQGVANNPPGSSVGLRLDNGQADMTLAFSRIRQYKIQIVAHVTDNFHEGLFRVQLGSSSRVQLRLQAEPGHQNFDLPPANYEPDQVSGDTELYILSLFRNTTIDETPGIENQAEQAVIVDWICVTDATQNPAGTDQATEVNGLSSLMDNIFGKANVGACPEEEATGTGDLLADVSKSLSFMWNCALRSAIGGIDKMGMDTMQFLSFFRLWFSLTTNGVIDSTGGSALAFSEWLGSIFGNTETAMSNAIIGGLQSAGIITTDGSQTAFEGAIGAVASTANDSIINLSDIWDLLGAAFNLVTAQVTTWFSETIGSLTGLWNTTNNAINHDPIPIPGIPACDDSSETIAEACLPIFMIDNTILGDSSILGSTLPIVKGAAGFALLWWAATYIRGQLKGAGGNEE